MLDMFKKLKNRFVEDKDEEVELGDEYVELDTNIKKESASKVIVKPFTLTKFEDVRDILMSIRAGHIISIINIAPLKDKEVSSLKRAVDKIKKTVDANDGDIAGFGNDFLVVTPSFAKIHRKNEPVQQPQQPVLPQEPQQGFSEPL